MGYDVVVAGGGPAGIGAAAAAARNGARTLLVEPTNCLGGMGTNGLVPFIRTAGDDGGIVAELYGRLASAGGAEVSDSHVWPNPCVYRMVALDLVIESGAEVLLHAFAEGVEMDGDRLAGVHVANKGGRALVRANAAVDATGDGDLAAWAGAPFDKGREGDGYLQAVSLNFVLAGVDADRRPSWGEFRALCREGMARGELEMPPYIESLNFGRRPPGYPPGVFQFQFDVATRVDGSDPADLSRGEVLCHGRVMKIWRFLRKHVSGYEDCVLVDVASHLGVRETRRVRGERTLVEADVLEARKHPDGVCRASFYMDTHDGIAKTPEFKRSLAPPEGDYYEIPYGCLVPLRVDGLLVSGRCISSTRAANGSLRLQATCMNTGQAAGTAAAICSRDRVAPRAIDGARLRETLAGQGMAL